MTSRPRLALAILAAVGGYLLWSSFLGLALRSRYQVLAAAVWVVAFLAWTLVISRRVPVPGGPVPAVIAFKMPVRWPWWLLLALPLGLLFPVYSWTVFSGACALPSESIVLAMSGQPVLPTAPPWLEILGRAVRETAFPLLEELYFRGRFLSLLSLLIGRQWAIILTTVGFAYAHASPQFFVKNLVGGGVFAAAAVGTRSIWAAVILHYIYNVTLSLTAVQAAEGVRTRIAESGWLRCDLSLAILAVSVVGLIGLSASWTKLNSRYVQRPTHPG